MAIPRQLFLGTTILTLFFTTSLQATSRLAGGRTPTHLLPASMASPGVAMKPDQVNTAGWDEAWTNLVNDVQQSFRPSLPKLVAVEVKLVVGNAGAGEEELTLTVLDKTGEPLAAVTEVVRESDCEHTIFVLPEGGVNVTPGESYRIKLSGGNTFGWKYVQNGYPKGRATFNGKPLLPNARSTFLFRTFGSE